MTHRYCARCSALMQANTTCPKCGHPHGAALAATHRGQAHRRLAKAAIAAHPWCTRCARRPPLVRLTAHHLRYPALTTAHLEVLCLACHANETNTPSI